MIYCRINTTQITMLSAKSLIYLDTLSLAEIYDSPDLDFLSFKLKFTVQDVK